MNFARLGYRIPILLCHKRLYKLCDKADNVSVY